MNTLYHKTLKRIEHVNPESWETVITDGENGWKFELFLSDILPQIEEGRLGILIVDRKTEYAPIKNDNS